MSDRSAATSSSAAASNTQPQTSLRVFRKFIIRLPSPGGAIGEEILDATRVISKECFDHWVSTRKRVMSSMEKAFQRSLSAHLTASDGRSPFTSAEEFAILRVVRKKQRWPCFPETETKYGAMGFRTKGFHERQWEEANNGRRWSPEVMLVVPAGGGGGRLRRNSVGGGGGEDAGDYDDNDDGDDNDDDDRGDDEAGGGGDNSGSDASPQKKRVRSLQQQQPPRLERRYSSSTNSLTGLSTIAAAAALHKTAIISSSPYVTAPALLPPNYHHHHHHPALAPPPPPPYGGGKQSSPYFAAAGAATSSPYFPAMTMNMSSPLLLPAAALGGGGAQSGLPPLDSTQLFLSMASSMLTKQQQQTTPTGSDSTNVWSTILNLGRMHLMSQAWGSPTQFDAQRLLAMYLEHRPHSVVLVCDMTCRDANQRVMCQSPAARQLMGNVSRTSDGASPSSSSPSSSSFSFTSDFLPTNDSDRWSCINAIAEAVRHPGAEQLVSVRLSVKGGALAAAATAGGQAVGNGEMLCVLYVCAFPQERLLVIRAL